MTPDLDRVIALAASASLTLFALAWLLSWKPKQREAAMPFPTLQVTFIQRAPVARQEAARPSADGIATAPRARPLDSRGERSNTERTQPDRPRPLDLRVPAEPVSFAPDPMRRRPKSLDVEHLQHFESRDWSIRARSKARDCAELRASLAKGANAEIILRSMQARECTL